MGRINLSSSNPWHLPVALVWLEGILRERFGHKFSLKVSGISTLIITLEGYARCVKQPLYGAMFTRADSELPCAHWDAAEVGGGFSGNIPAPGVDQLPVPLITASPQGWHIGYDILGLAYWMLTRQEEVGRADLDNHGRFPATSSHAFKYGYLERPIVDEWFHVLGQVMLKVWPGLELKKNNFTIRLSHDVDTPSLYGFKSWSMIGRMIAGDLLKRHDVRSCVMAPLVRFGTRSTLHSEDPYNTFDWIMDQSEANNLRSAFYFICGRTDIDHDADYDPGHPAIRNLMRRIHERGHEIGLHPSYASYQTCEVITAEARRLRDIVASEGIIQPEWGGAHALFTLGTTNHVACLG